MIRVYLLDDHEVVRRGLRDLLEAEGDIVVVGESASALEATRRIPPVHPDVMILDARLADGNGISVCRDVRSVDPTIQALILTSYEDDEAFLSAVIAGAKGYLLKQVRSTSLVRSVRAIAAGQNLLDPSVTRTIRERMQKDTSRPAELAPLTVQELRVFDLIAGGHTNREIAERLGLAEKTVRNYVSRILDKLGLESRTQAAILATRLTRDPRR
ncbi:DNA-binding response regulator [Bacillus sp. SRB_336]|nr:DNA-binding response regulator [Bacillus sp. SRB_336]